MSNQISFAREKGYVETILKRKRYLPEINSRNAILRSSAERNAINTPVQGSAADIIKLSMIRIDNEFEKKSLKSKLLLQVMMSSFLMCICRIRYCKTNCFKKHGKCYPN